MIGKTEEAILLTLMRVGSASAVRVADEVSKHHETTVGAAYTTLTRMVEKGWVERREPSEEERGVYTGRARPPRGVFTILPAGREAVEKSIETTKQFMLGTELECPVPFPV